MMRFVHIGDIHLGKMIYQQNLLEIQSDLLDQVCQYLIDNNIDVLVMAGDIYDRSIPSGEAVTVLNEFLTKVVLQHHKKVLMIAGNHDSASRLSFVSGLLKQEGLYIEAYPAKKIKPIVIDGVNFYLVPFFKPSYIRYLYNDDKITTYQEAFATYLKNQDIDFNQTNVLITHQFIAGNHELVRSESEAILNVGGSEIIDVSLIKQFDYVALGHLHASQKVSKDTIRYSGSLMAYSFDETDQKKSIVDVTINDKETTFKLVSLKPKQNLIKIKGKFADLMADDYPSNHHDFIAVELEDQTLIPNAIDYLRTKFMNILQITYARLNTLENTNNLTKADSGFEKLNSVELFEQFYQKIKGENLSDQAKQIITDILAGGDENAA